jgi:hypothetical protein
LKIQFSYEGLEGGHLKIQFYKKGRNPNPNPYFFLVLCERVLQSALELGLSFEDVSGVEQVIDMSLSMSSEMKMKTNEFVGGANHVLLSSLLELYNELLLGDMVEGQRSFEVITPLFRTSSFYLSSASSSSSSSASESSRVKLSSPVSLLESLSLSQSKSSSNTDPSSSNSSASVVQSITLPSWLSYPLRMSLLETRPTTVISGGDSHAMRVSCRLCWEGCCMGFRVRIPLVLLQMMLMLVV